MASTDRLPVLTYHSISQAGGPTSIPPAVFAMQIGALADAGYSSLTLEQYRQWHAGEHAGGERKVLITFDDAFRDFTEAAAPVLQRHGFGALVFVPTAQVGSAEAWDGANAPARALMDWAEIRRLASQGFEFGSHGRTHAMLPKLAREEREVEIRDSAAELETGLGQPGADAFAAPYGAVDGETVAAIARIYSMAFGTRLAISRRGADRHDLPRLDMHYFRSERAWRGFLEGERAYLTLRRGLRAVRNSALALAA